MATRGLGISAIDLGLGATLAQNLLMVPPNQRSYKWEDAHVEALFDDLSAALQHRPDEPYFLGTLVLSQTAGDRPEVADGQQRLATTSILIAAIRDRLEHLGTHELRVAHKYTEDFLLEYDEHTGENTPRLRLNYVDNGYFIDQILRSASDGTRRADPPETPSHQRLFKAAALARLHIEKILSQHSKPDAQAKELYKWIKFIKEMAMVIVIRVPDTINAYTMFETLNDRGLRAGQTDILKSFFFGRAGEERRQDMQHEWSSMATNIETVGDEDLLITYIRHHWALTHGYTPERELASLVKKEITSRQDALKAVSSLDELSSDYAGLQTPLEYAGWTNIDRETRSYIYIMTNVLAIEQILPLLLAVLKKFSNPTLKSAMRMFLSWSVRFLVAGSGGGGPLDRAYGQLAKLVYEGTITTVAQLREQVRAGVLRTDAEFKQAFSKARVTRAALARYYLRALELRMESDHTNADLGGTLDEHFLFNVEHVLPNRESVHWPIAEQTSQQFRKRLGNMVLLKPEDNVRLGNKGFDEKRRTYAASPMLLTQGVGTYLTWGPAEIDAWQERLAEIAVLIWPE